MEKRAFYLKHMNEHIQYLQRIRSTLNGNDNFSGTECTQGALGKWIYGEALEEIRAFGDDMHYMYETLIELHQQFHTASDSALKCHSQNDELGQYREMTQMHLLSNELVQTLLKMDRISQSQPLNQQRHAI